VSFYANGFPPSLKGFIGGPIKGKLNQFLKELCDRNGELVRVVSSFRDSRTTCRAGRS
jgi:hypothetical protein